MAVCQCCDLEMLDHVSCREIVFEFEGPNGPVLFAPIPYGMEERFEGDRLDNACHDCGVPLSGFHHVGCDMEECPRCHRQAISCNCPRFNERHEGDAEERSEIQALLG